MDAKNLNWLFWELRWNWQTCWLGSTLSKDVYSDVHAWVRGVESVLAKKQYYLYFPFTHSTPCAFLSIIHFTLQIIWFWTIVCLVRDAYKWVKMEILHLIKTCEMLYCKSCDIVYIFIFCICKICHGKYFECLKLGCFFFKPEKGMFYLSIKFHCCFLFAGEITMVETGPALVFQDYWLGLKKIR